MERAVRRKFELHAELRQLLLSTGDEELQEAAPIDYYWVSAATAAARTSSG